MITESLLAVNQRQPGKVYNRIKNVRAFGRCCLCLKNGSFSFGMCSDCINDLPENKQFCQICCEPLANNWICGKCLISPSKIHDRVLAPFRYEYPINKLITKIKFGEDLPAALRLGRLAARWFKNQTEGRQLPEMILPVPLHKNRIRQRGYNQSLLLAKPVGSLLGIPLSVHQHGRKTNTLAQSDLDAKERRRNVRGAFYCSLDLKGKHVAIFDDVITTGATTGSFAEALRRAGANKIEVWAVARRGI